MVSKITNLGDLGDEPDGEEFEDVEGQEWRSLRNPGRRRTASPGLGLRGRTLVSAIVWRSTLRGATYGSTPNEARNDLVLPEELPYPYWPHRFHSERYTRCETRDQWGRLQVAEVYDDWRVQGRGQPPFAPWTGATLFVFEDGQVPWVEVPADESGGPDAGGGGGRPGGGQGDSQWDWNSWSSTDWQGLNDRGQWQGWSSWSWRGTRAGGSSWVDFEQAGISGKAATPAMSYIQEVDKIQGNEARAWQSISRAR